ncbi:hypothetical protein A8B82_21205 [Sulfitobacter sp. EhC04]|nr:hypothetical protein A8B82_21205 [Sulfitobacter sp. EhC04]
MSSAPQTRADDERYLRILDMRDGDGLSGAVIGSRPGMGRGSVSRIINSIYRAELPCRCMKPENKDGGLPRGWWR